MLSRGFQNVAMAFLFVAALIAPASSAGESPFVSHHPMRPLPEAGARPLRVDGTWFVDGESGSDDNSGAREAPWKTIRHGLGQLKPGETLVLRGGTYFEHAAVSIRGTADQPITIRGYPGELAVLDGGLREFQQGAQSAWEPAPGGAEGEFRSTRAYPQLVQPERYRHEVALVGNFADSLVPLHGYRFPIDFRARNEYWTVDNKLSTASGVYCGPGLWLDPETARIHVRLAHTHLKTLGKENYRGETGPRKLPLVVAGYDSPLVLDGARHVRLQDLVVRGSAGNTLDIRGCEDVQLDGVTVYGGAPALHVHATTGLHVRDSAFRGLSAPWSSRASHKYRGISPYLVIFSGESPPCRDVEIESSEFTDNHDGVILGTIQGLRFHHNFVENFDDDGLYLTLSRSRPPRDLRIYQNYLARSHTLFSFAESGRGVKNEIGDGVFIYRNVIDFRRHTASSPPVSAAADAAGTASERQGRPASDHGSPVWDPLFFYHNTVIAHDPAPSYRGDYGSGIASHTRGTRRRVFDNLFVQTEGLPGLRLAAGDDDVQVDGNLHWSTSEGPGFEGDYFAKARKQHAPTWAAHDIFADPRFVRFDADSPTVVLQLRPDSPAVDAGVAVPADWPDPLRNADAGKPDIGAIPRGAKPWRVGVRGRFTCLLQP